MRRVVGWTVAGTLAAALAGCCADAKRFYENAYGFNNPDIEYYPPGPPAPVTTPPGYTEPAVPAIDTETPNVRRATPEDATGEY
jgi:hypothetical protein